MPTLFTSLSCSVAIILLMAQTAAAGLPTAGANTFISASSLHRLMDGGAVDDLVIMEVGWGGPEEYYDKGHIPSAIHVNTDEIEYDEFKPRATTDPKELGRSTTPEQDQVKGLGPDATLPRNWWNLYPDRYLLPALAAMGVDIDSTVVLYGKDQTGAARLAWTLLYAGVRDVRLLDGGLAAWQKAGYPVSKETTRRSPKPDFGTDKPLHSEYLVDIAFVRKAIGAGTEDVTIVDIRTRDEYEGRTAPYSYIPTKGRIKNAKWGKAGNGPWTMDFYLNEDGTFRPVGEIERMWAENGITGENHLAFYCGTAWRSSLAFLYARELGWQRISNFDSSWYEWSMGPEKDRNPIE